MSGKRKGAKGKAIANQSGGGSSSSKHDSKNSGSVTNIPSNVTNNNEMQSTGYLVTCDVPTKQYIQYLNELKPVDKKFILQDLDATHLLVELKARDEIERKVEDWLDENIFSAVEKVGEDLDMS
jgi:TFIIH basal transcription factor complex TTD-A subunit